MNEVSCVLLSIAGYNHCESYRRKWENKDVPDRLITGRVLSCQWWLAM